MNFTKTTLLCAVFAFGMAASASATVFFTDGFDYENGQLTDSEAGAGQNVSGGVWVGHSGQTHNDNVQVVDGKAIINNSGSEDVNASIGKTLAAGETIYAAFAFTVTDTRENAADDINNDYFFHFKDNGYGFRSRVYLDNPSGSGGFGLGLTSYKETQVKWGSDLNFGQQYVGVISFDYTYMHLFKFVL